MKRQADVMTADTKRHIRCEDLKCYKATLDMLVYATQLLNHMPRELRYTLGHRTIEDIHGIMRGIYRTFYADEERKRESLDRALDSMVDVMADCRVMYALRMYNDNVNMHLAEQVATTDTNLSKWRNSLRKNAR
ncbi:MAG: hypothetical protein IJ620_03255 [Bacteroidales bacterium]|nr:hypothetical protein [Bacteroidales bacterium]